MQKNRMKNSPQNIFMWCCFGTETWNDWPERENRLIPCKGRHSPSLFFFLCFEKEVGESVLYCMVSTGYDVLVARLTFGSGNSKCFKNLRHEWWWLYLGGSTGVAGHSVCSATNSVNHLGTGGAGDSTPRATLTSSNSLSAANIVTHNKSGKVRLIKVTKWALDF